jgi:hypothetical protein
MGGRSLIPLARVHREAAGLKAGDAVTVTLTVEDGPRDVDVPALLAAAVKDAGLTERFAQLAYSRRKEFARQVIEAKAEATRDRRIAKVLDDLRAERGRQADVSRAGRAGTRRAPRPLGRAHPAWDTRAAGAS